MSIWSMLAVCSFFSFPPDAEGLVGEELFPVESACSTEYPVLHIKYTGNEHSPWVSLLFQKMIKEYFEGLASVHGCSRPSSRGLSIACDTEQDVAVAIQKLKTEGFLEKHLEEAKSAAKQILEVQDQLACAQMIDAIELPEFSSLLSSLHMVFPEHLKELLTHKTSITSLELYHQLPLHESEKELIHDIISTMAKKNPVELAFRKNTLERKGKKINHVHPLRFLGYIFADPHLKSSMKKIKKSYFKWEAFIDGLSKKMKYELSHDNLYLYLEGFSQHVRVDRDHVAKYIKNHDWEGLVNFLL